MLLVDIACTSWAWATRTRAGGRRVLAHGHHDGALIPYPTNQSLPVHHGRGLPRLGQGGRRELAHGHHDGALRVPALKHKVAQGAVILILRRHCVCTGKASGSHVTSCDLLHPSIEDI